jgi:NAD+ diphosphatase
MVGFFAKAKTDKILIDKNELDDARWFSIDEIRDCLNGNHPTLSLPPSSMSSHQLLRTWASRFPPKQTQEPQTPRSESKILTE